MRILKNNVTKIILASLIFPISLSLLGIIFRNKSGNLWQGIGDLVVFLVAYLLNSKYFGEKVYWSSNKNIYRQFVIALPAIIIVAFLNSPVLAVSDFKVKFDIIIVCLLVGLAEEYVFRGVILGLFMKVTHNNAFGAVIGSSIMFGLIHMINLKSLPIGYVSAQVLFAAAVGIIFGTIYLLTNNLAIVILLHALRDMFPMFSSKMMAEASQTQFSMATLYVMVFFLIIALIISYAQLSRFELAKREA